MESVSQVAEVSTDRDCVTRKTNRTKRTRTGRTSGGEVGMIGTDSDESATNPPESEQ